MKKHEAHTSSALSMNSLISKTRKPKFELCLKIYDLINVPLVTGTSLVKWYVSSSTATEYRGRTEWAIIKEHKVSWRYKRIIPLRLIIDKNNHLQDCMINFEVVQDCSTPIKADKITLGKIELNLAEYVDVSDNSFDDDESIVRRYLMQDSKINSTLKIGIWMKQIDGERNFTAPMLKMAIVFGGITGIVAREQEDAPSMFRSREQGEIQDLYHQILAASWASNEGELAADQCINDIFNGGDGWPHNENPKPKETDVFDDGTQVPIFSLRRNSLSGTSLKSPDMATSKKTSYNTPDDCRMSTDRSDAGMNIHRESIIESSQTLRDFPHNPNEVDEFSVRDDLIAWKVWQGPNY